mgnify:CR=1 FL=1
MHHSLYDKKQEALGSYDLPGLPSSFIHKHTLVYISV